MEQEPMISWVETIRTLNSTVVEENVYMDTLESKIKNGNLFLKKELMKARRDGWDSNINLYFDKFLTTQLSMLLLTVLLEYLSDCSIRVSNSM